MRSSNLGPRPFIECGEQGRHHHGHARCRGPGERVNAELKNWRNLRKIRSCPHRAAELVAAARPPATSSRRDRGERANAQLKVRRVLREAPLLPRRVTDLVKAVLVLIQAG